MKLIHKLEPVWWLLFGAGGFAAALVLPAIFFSIALAGPLGLFPERALAFHRVYDLAASPVGRVLLGAVLTLTFWHSAHHLRHFALDLGLHRVQATVSYGLYGLAGADTLDGRGGDDTLEGGSGDDTMTGGLGDDSFVFADGHGNDTITDFVAGAAGGDVIDLRRLTAAASFTDVMAAAAQIGDDTVIDFGDGNSITLLGVGSTQLEEQDFLF